MVCKKTIQLCPFVSVIVIVAIYSWCVHAGLAIIKCTADYLLLVYKWKNLVPSPHERREK